MNSLRNPFRARASEDLSSENNFLKLFSDLPLDILIERAKNEELWNTPLFIRSSPGAGKTSLLRVFTPASLIALRDLRQRSDYTTLYSKLKALGCITKDQIELLGIKITCIRDYSLVSGLDTTDNLKKALLFSLLDSRFILSACRGFYTLLDQENTPYESFLERISIVVPPELDLPQEVKAFTNLKQFYIWSKQREKVVYNYLTGSTYNLDESYLAFSISSFRLLTPSNITINGRPITSRVLFMLDDAHFLDKSLRDVLVTYLYGERFDASIWIAERLEAIRNDEPSGSLLGRDFGKPVYLENYWYDKETRFSKVLMDIADRRLKVARESPDYSFESLLQNELVESAFKEKIEGLNESLLEIIQGFSKYTSGRYDQWIQMADQFEGTSLEKGYFLLKMQVLIERSKKQQSLFALSPIDLQNEGQKLQASTIQYLFSRKSGIPFYFGVSVLTKLASCNIEQFLELCAALFDGVLGEYIKRTDAKLGSDKQQKILRKVTEERWNELPRILPYGDKCVKFLQNLVNEALRETDRPSSPYAPGVTGIGIQQIQEPELFSVGDWVSDPAYSELTKILNSCIAYNLLQVKRDKKQGKKDQKWTLLFLNRWICLRFGLPLSHSGWRPKKPKDLHKWIK